MPLISVIVPIYNVAPYLEKCLNSILQQKFTDFEVLLIDDGSTDNSREICQKYVASDHRFTYIYKTNGGLSSARNLGIKKSSADFLFFLDSDDYIAKDTLCQLYQPVLSHPDLELIIGGYNTVDAKTNIVTPFYAAQQLMIFNTKNNAEKERLYTKLFTDKILKEVAWNKLYHKNIFENTLFPYRLFEDTFIAPEIYHNAEKIAFIPEIIYNYLINRNQSIVDKYKKISIFSLDSSFFYIYRTWLLNPDSKIITIEFYRYQKHMLKKLKAKDFLTDIPDENKLILKKEFIALIKSLPAKNLPLRRRFDRWIKF